MRAFIKGLISQVAFEMLFEGIPKTGISGLYVFWQFR